MATPGGAGRSVDRRMIRALTFDFFQTLARHRLGDGGRGRALVAYMQSVGIEHRPWRHEILYDVFELHARDYSPQLAPDAKREYLVRLAQRALDHVAVACPPDAAAQHAAKIWELIGPASLELYPDVHDSLGSLREAGYPLAVVSNYPCGLGHFCAELGIGRYFDHVLVSAEVGHAKPSREIFDEAARRLGVAPHAILHVGDSIDDDVEGARAAGFHAVLIDREGAQPASPCPTVRDLRQVSTLLDGGLEPSLWPPILR